MRFTKGHGTGNDFVLLPDPDGDLALPGAAVAALCDRRRGIGADGVLRVVLTAAVPEHADLAGAARWFMDYRNADGSVAETCGNGIRVFARYLLDAGYARGPRLRIATRAGVREVAVAGDAITVDMGTPGLDPPPGLPDGATFVSMGNPHLVVFRASVDDAPVATEGPRLAAALPAGANVEYAAVRGPAEIDARIWERGVGETSSCGTGACAVVVAARLTGRSGPAADVRVPGGTLRVEWSAAGPVLLTGPAVLVADGEIRAGWLAGEDPGPPVAGGGGQPPCVPRRRVGRSSG